MSDSTKRKPGRHFPKPDALSRFLQAAFEFGLDPSPRKGDASTRIASSGRILKRFNTYHNRISAEVQNKANALACNRGLHFEQRFPFFSEELRLDFTEAFKNKPNNAIPLSETGVKVEQNSNFKGVHLHPEACTLP